MKYLLLLSVFSVQAAQQTKQLSRPVESYIRTAQTAREEIRQLLAIHREKTDAEKIKLSRNLRFLHHELHNSLLQARFDYEQYCKKVRMEKKAVLGLMAKV